MADPTLVCCIAHAFDRGDGVPVVVPHGAIVAASDIAPDRRSFFAEHGTPSAERPRVEDFVGPGVESMHIALPSDGPGRVKIRVLGRGAVVHGNVAHQPGAELEVDAGTAQQLAETGFVEVLGVR
jgi:hypothetical protein